MRRGSELRPEEIGYGDFTADISAGEIACKGRSVRLGAKELELIRLLIANRGILLSKEAIYLKIWGYDGEADDNIVEVYISFLRKKLEHIGSKVKISVVRRVGYQLEMKE
jgi:DNA-binding response OmpR family regulator